MAMTTEENTASAVTPSISQNATETDNSRFDSDVPESDKKWFPMRIAFGRTERTMGIKKYLDDHHVENFLPMTHKKVLIGNRQKRVLVPAINNLIFIRTSENCLKGIKRTRETLLPLRFMMWHSLEGSVAPQIISIPQKAMVNFMRVASVEDDKVMFLGDKDFSNKIGRRVRVIDGVFKGVEGTIYRVKKDRRVVVSLENVCSVAISYINPAFLEEITDDNN